MIRNRIEMKISPRLVTAAAASFILLSALSEGAAVAAVSEAVRAILARADKSYQGGDCEKAIVDYNALAGHAEADAPTRSLAQFRSAYCYLTTGESAKAELGFNRVLGADPANGEARAKLAQSLFNQARYRDAKAAARLVPSASPFRTEADVLSARSSIEAGEHRQALSELESLKAGADWKPVVDYWKAVALYHLDEDERAEKLFKTARDTSPSTLWVKSEAQSWLEAMKNESQRLHIQLTGGAYYDGNVAQSATRTQNGGVGAGPSGPGGQNGAPGPLNSTNSTVSAAIQDRGLSGTVDVTFAPVHTRKFNLELGVESNGTFYQSQNSYNYEALTGKIDTSYQFDTSLSAGLTTSYENTRYAYAYYQDYLFITPYLNWSAEQDLFLGFSVPLTINMVTRPSFTYAPAVTAKYDLGAGFYLLGGASYTSANGEAAVYTSTQPPSVSSGTAFSRYTTIGGYAGVSTTLPLEIETSFQVSMYSTSYAAENVSLGVGQPAPAARNDRLTTLQLTLSRAIIAKRWSLGLTASSANNVSTGFPGVGSAGSVPDNNYSRIYGMLSTTLYY